MCCFDLCGQVRCPVPCVSMCCFDLCGQVREYWLSYELEMVNYQNKCRLIKGWDDLFSKCKEHINQVVAMKLSPYFKVGTGSDTEHSVPCRVSRGAHCPVWCVCVLCSVFLY